jgi:cation:H+ antiporter
MLTAIAIVVGLLMLYFGGEMLVRGSVAIATALGLSPLLIGITLVGFGTSAPELMTSLSAALRNAPGIAIGNVVGSNIANILLILGIAAIIAPVACSPRAFARDVSAVVVSGIVVVGLAAFGAIGRVTGLILFLALIAYLAFAYFQERSDGTPSATYHEHAAGVPPAAHRLWLNLLLAVGGIATVVFGAHVLVDGAIELAGFLGVPDTVVGLTVVAVGTSLPELAATVAAALRREGDIVLGNILGSSIFNAFGILGATALVRPLVVPPEIFRFDAWVLLVTTLLLAVFALTGQRLSRMEGVVLVAGYGAYVGYLVAGVVA